MSGSDDLTAANGDLAGETQHGWIAAGSVLGAFAAASCCLLPLALFGIGVGGAWIGNLTALAPYQPLILAVTGGTLAYGFYIVYAKPRKACADDADCARPASRKAVKIALWTATVLATAAGAFPFVAPLLLAG